MSHYEIPRSSLQLSRLAAQRYEQLLAVQERPRHERVRFHRFRLRVQHV